MNGTFSRQQTDAKAVDHEIIAPQDGDVPQQASAAKTQAGTPKVYWLAAGVSHVKTKQALAKSCVPARTFRQCKIQPAFCGEKTNAERKEKRRKLCKTLAEGHPGTMIEEGI